MNVRTSLTREDWVEAAQNVLVSGGVDAVRVDTLAKQMKITRGSFYYHFKSRDELLAAILDNWRAHATEDVIRNLRNAHQSPVQQLQHLLELPAHGQRAKEAAAIELAIRGWARRDKQARQAMDEVDSHRLTYIESLLMQLGISEQEADARAYLIYSYQLSQSLLPQHNERARSISEILIPGATVAA